MIIAFAGIVLMISEGLALGEFFGNIMALGTALFFSCFAITLRKFRKLDMLPTLLIAGLMVSCITLIMTYNFIKIPVNDIFLCFICSFNDLEKRSTFLFPRCRVACHRKYKDS